MRLWESRTTEEDLLFVIDNSPQLPATLPARLVAFVEQLVQLHDQFNGGVSFHIGIVPADGSLLRGGCGIAGDRAFLELDEANGVSNLDGSRTLADTLACLFAVGNAGSASQQPISASLQVLEDGLPVNHDFSRPTALLAVFYVAAAEYTDPRAAEALDFFTRSGGARLDPNDVELASIAPPSPTLDSLVGAVRYHGQVALDADPTPLLNLCPRYIPPDRLTPCLASPLSHPEQPDCSVVDGEQVVEWCGRTSYRRPCWQARQVMPCPDCGSCTTIEILQPPQHDPLPQWRDPLVQCDCVP
jgi:hypothetical protein